MNASFSILQKIKGQFLQSTPNKADFQVAFAPFAFTLSNDDFYFLRNNATSGAEARKYLKEQSEFAFMANSVLKNPNLWKIDGENLLYDTYRRLLGEAKRIDPDVLTSDETSKINTAKGVLFSGNGSDSAKYKAYKKYVAKVAEIDKKTIDWNAARTAIAETDTAALAKWTLESQALAGARKDLLIEWQVKGYKSAVESAKASYDTIIFSKTTFNKRWDDASTFTMAPPNLMNDEFGVEFFTTTCVPNAICDYQAPIWKKLVLSKADITQLTQTFTQEVPVAVLAEFGDVQPELDSISFEYCLLDIQRPWFDETLINNRLWKFADASQLLSSGDDNLAGQLPAYPVKMILAKNVDLQFTPNSPVNDDIKTRLRNGSRLLFGPLLLKTIPMNLTDDKISGLRVQPLTTPELAVMTRVAVQGGLAQPPNTALLSRLQMIQVLNQRPQMLMRQNQALVPLKGAALAGAAMAAGPAAALAPARPAMAAMVAMPQPALAVPPATAMLAAREMSPTALAPGATFMPLRRPDLGMLRPGLPIFRGDLSRVPPVVIESSPPRPPTPPAPPTAVSLAGKVIGSTGVALQVAEVLIVSLATGANQSVLSAEDGSYSLKDVPTGRYQLKARKTGFVTQDKTLELNGNATQDFLLEAQAELTETFQVIGVICKRLPRLPNPLPDISFV